MQDRYAGDIGDYGKTGLLRALRARGLTVAINWYLTEPLKTEKKTDGSFKQGDGKYLIPEKLIICDSALAETLTGIAQGETRSVSALEEANLISGALYHHDPVPVKGRSDWHRAALRKFKNADLVFLDPDNGLLVKSVGKSSVKSVKYAFYEEVRDYLQQGQSVLIYNHRCRKPETRYFHEICDKLEAVTGLPAAKILKITFPKCSVRDYFALSVTSEHHQIIKSTFHAMEKGIWGKTGMCRIPRSKNDE